MDQDNPPIVLQLGDENEQDGDDANSWEAEDNIANDDSDAYTRADLNDDDDKLLQFSSMEEDSSGDERAPGL